MSGAWDAQNPTKVRAYKAAYRERNREKLRAQGRKDAKLWRQRNPEKLKENNRLWHEKNGDRKRAYARNYHRERKYGLTTDDVAAMLPKQNSACLGCGTSLTTTTACVDHCHKTGRVRGLLCGRCNLALGHVADDPHILRRLAAYLEKETTWPKI